MQKSNKEVFEESNISAKKSVWQVLEPALHEGESILAVNTAHSSGTSKKDDVLIYTECALYIIHSELLSKSVERIDFETVTDIKSICVRGFLTAKANLIIEVNDAGKLVQRRYDTFDIDFPDDFKAVVEHYKQEKEAGLQKERSSLFVGSEKKSKADKLLELRDLLQSGILTEDEFLIEKNKIMKG